jgi:hypothetical protein
MDALTKARKHLTMLGPHQRGRETAKHLESAIAEIEQLRARLDAALRELRLCSVVIVRDDELNNDDLM